MVTDAIGRKCDEGSCKRIISEISYRSYILHRLALPRTLKRQDGTQTQLTNCYKQLQGTRKMQNIHIFEISNFQLF
jgi:hypothetical protein